NRYDELRALPAGAVVGTSSLRRAAMVRAAHPRLCIESLRGNLDTRLRKLDDGQYDAIILAAVGLLRLGLGARIQAVLTPEESLPAPGQGALGIEIPAGRADVEAWVAPLNDAQTGQCVASERAFSRALGGSCEVPLGGYALVENDELWLRGFVATPDGGKMVSGELRGAPGDAVTIGEQLAQRLRAQGADAILAEIDEGDERDHAR
ncbi:MAG: hydroxymethylbilane synthase, partial [Propionivibrio sp.]